MLVSAILNLENAVDVLVLRVNKEFDVVKDKELIAEEALVDKVVTTNDKELTPEDKEEIPEEALVDKVVTPDDKEEIPEEALVDKVAIVLDNAVVCDALVEISLDNPEDKVLIPEEALVDKVVTTNDKEEIPEEVVVDKEAIPEDKELIPKDAVEDKEEISEEALVDKVVTTDDKELIPVDKEETAALLPVERVDILLNNKEVCDCLVEISLDNPVDKDIILAASNACPELIRFDKLAIIEVSTPVKKEICEST